MKAFLNGLAVALLVVVSAATAHAQVPSLSPIPDVSVNAGGTLSVNVIAVDPLGRVITVTGAVPPFATLNAPTIGTGVVATTLTLTPSTAEAGVYSAEVEAAAGGVSTIRVFRITVNAAGSNRAPVVTAPPLQQVTAGAALTFVVSASDPDGDAISSFTASGLPATASFTPNGSNTSGTFAWTPGATDAGEYDVQFTAQNALSGTGVTHIRVAGAPTLMITPIADVTVAGGASASVPVHASGVAGALITLTASLPAFATLNPPGSGTSVVNTTVSVSPPRGSAGTYHAAVTATSEGASVTQPFDIIVTGDVGGGNYPPVLTAPATATVAIGATLSFGVTATDPDSDHVDLFGSALPPGSTFMDHANDTGTFMWTPASGQAGTYTASFTGTDGRGGSGSASTIITVTGGTVENHPPTLTAPATESVNEGDHLSFTVTATDPDGDHVALSAGSLPAGATFTDHGDDTGTLSWTPDTTQSGSYNVAFLGNDGRGGTGTASTKITVVDVTGGGGGGGGGGVVAGSACLIGRLRVHRDSTCFRIRPIHHSFDLRDVVLSSLRLRFHSDSLATMKDAWIEVACRGNDHGGDDQADGDGGNHGERVVRANAGDSGDQGDDDDDQGDGCNVSCKKHGDDHGDEHGDDRGGEHGSKCDTLGIRACFSTEALVLLFSGANPNAAHDQGHLPCALLHADIRATLKSGATVIATFGGRGDDDDSDKDADREKDKHRDDHGDDLEGATHANVMPNPLNPGTRLTFTTAQYGRVRVTVYDMQGRLVKNLLDDSRVAGAQALSWDGTNQGNLRVARGVYFLRIQTPDGSSTRRVAVVN